MDITHIFCLKGKILIPFNGDMDFLSPLFEKKNAFYYLIKKENLSTFFSATPVPLTTARNGSSAIWN